MSKEEIHSIFNNLLLALQLCLGLWQFLKLTPLGALVQGGMGWLLSLLPFRLSDYARLQPYEGRVFKRVYCLVLSKAGSHDELAAVSTPISVGRSEIFQLSYLGDDFQLERREGNKLFVNGKMSYYITDVIWQNLLVLERLGAGIDVIVKGNKDFWEQMVTGGVMMFDKVLDCMILEDHRIQRLNDYDWLLPVNLSVSEEKLLKVLNLGALFLQTHKNVYWLIPILISFTSAVLEFNVTLRAWLYDNINKVFCYTVQMICDPLPYLIRKQLYILGIWVENLKPCNDIQLKVVRGDITAVIGGGAKAHKEGATLMPSLSVEGETIKTFNCGRSVITCEFFEEASTCIIYEIGMQVNCSKDEFKNLLTFISCVQKNRSGSLKSYNHHNKVRVRRWRESIQCYMRNGFPSVYELRLENVICQ